MVTAKHGGGPMTLHKMQGQVTKIRFRDNIDGAVSTFLNKLQTRTICPEIQEFKTIVYFACSFVDFRNLKQILLPRVLFTC